MVLADGRMAAIATGTRPQPFSRLTPIQHPPPAFPPHMAITDEADPDPDQTTMRVLFALVLATAAALLATTAYATPSPRLRRRGQAVTLPAATPAELPAAATMPAAEDLLPLPDEPTGMPQMDTDTPPPPPAELPDDALTAPPTAVVVLPSAVTSAPTAAAITVAAAAAANVTISANASAIPPAADATVTSPLGNASAAVNASSIPAAATATVESPLTTPVAVRLLLYSIQDLLVENGLIH